MSFSKNEQKNTSRRGNSTFAFRLVWHNLRWTMEINSHIHCALLYIIFSEEAIYDEHDKCEIKKLDSLLYVDSIP